MTDDTVVVTQSARIGAADLLDELSSLLDHNGIGQVADLIRDGEYDEHEAVQAIAAAEQRGFKLCQDAAVARAEYERELADDNIAAGYDVAVNRGAKQSARRISFAVEALSIKETRNA